MYRDIHCFKNYRRPSSFVFFKMEEFLSEAPRRRILDFVAHELFHHHPVVIKEEAERLLELFPLIAIDRVAQ